MRYNVGMTFNQKKEEMELQLSYAEQISNLKVRPNPYDPPNADYKGGFWDARAEASVIARGADTEIAELKLQIKTLKSQSTSGSSGTVSTNKAC